MCDSDSGLSISMNGSQNDSPTQGLVFIRVTMPDETSETFSFSPTDLIVDVKLTAIKRSSSCLKDELNYGLFLPPSKGKAGKFLQEDRMLLDYPFEGSVGHLELKYKQRVYRVLRTNVNKLRKINTKSCHFAYDNHNNWETFLVLDTSWSFSRLFYSSINSTCMNMESNYNYFSLMN
ncbi:unnamed protein product [Schistosoma guineensis]|nr:unnamed protein product [Schistosoma guineensis]